MEESAELHFALEAVLCLKGYGYQQIGIGAPGGDSTVISAPFLIVDDEGIYTVTQALLQHDQAADPAVIILKRMDLLKAHMKVQDVVNVGRTFLIILEQSCQSSADIFGADAELVGRCPVFAGPQLLLAVGIGAVCKDMVQFFDECLRQRRGNVIDDISHSGKVIDGFDNIIHLNWLKCRADLIGAVDLLHLVSCQTIAGNAVGGVGQVHLNVLIDAVVVILVALVDDAFGEGCEIRFWFFAFYHFFRLGLVLPEGMN